MNWQYPGFCLANFKDQFIFLISNDVVIFQKKVAQEVQSVRRYSLAEGEWIEIQPSPWPLTSACSLGDKVYAIGFENEKSKQRVGILHNPDASFPSLKPPRWEAIKISESVFGGCKIALVPLNSTEIVILGGSSGATTLKTITTFDTTTGLFEKEFEDERLNFYSEKNQSAQVRVDTIIALMTKQTIQVQRLIMFTKGNDGGVMNLPCR